MIVEFALPLYLLAIGLYQEATRTWRFLGVLAIWSLAWFLVPQALEGQRAAAIIVRSS